MQNTFTIKQFQQARKKFEDYGQRLCSSDYSSFDSAVQLFIQFCESDQIISILTKQLKAQGAQSFDEWYNQITDKRRLGVDRVNLPPKQQERLPLLYKFLVQIAEHPHPRSLVLNIVRGGKNGSDYVAKLNKLYTSEFIKDFGYELDDLEQNLGHRLVNDRFNDTSLIIFAGAGSTVATGASIVNQGSLSGNVQITAGVGNEVSLHNESTDVVGLLEQISNLIEQDRELTEVRREQLKLDVESIRQELKLKEPRRSSLMERIKNLSACTSLVKTSIDLTNLFLKIYG